MNRRFVRIGLSALLLARCSENDAEADGYNEDLAAENETLKDEVADLEAEV